MRKTVARIISFFFTAFYKLGYGKKVSFGKKVIINHRFKIKGRGKLVIGDECNLWAHKEPNEFHFYHPDAIVQIGSKSRINGATFHCADSIAIGSACLIGSAIFMDTDFHSFDDPEHVLYKNPLIKPISIGSHVWIGGQSVVLKGCEIGSGSVVGFRAVVANSFPQQVVIAGNPARVVKRKADHST